MDNPEARSAPGRPASADRLALRQSAEKRHADRPMSVPAEQPAVSQLAMQHLLQELQVHQIELETQHDELPPAQTVLGAAQANYFDFHDLAPVGYCLVDDGGLITQANLTTAGLLGVMREVLIGQPVSRFIVADDQDTFRLFRQELLASDASLTCELRMYRADDSSFWVSLSALAVAAENGTAALRMVLTDMTERKSAEDKLQLAASVFNHAGEGIMVTDVNGFIIEVNDAFTLITGYSRAEVMGRSARLLSSGRQSAEFYEAMFAQLANCGYWSGELWNRHKNGEVYPELLAISTVRDAEGMVQRYVGLFSDMTLRKSHQQQLERMAFFDLLTGLPNRVLKADRLQQTMAMARRSGQKLAVVYVDLDGFKAINDRHGHVAGDQMLITVATHMQDGLRQGDTLARIGGDEFAAILVNLASIEACLPLLERLLVACAQPMNYGEQMLQVTASLGVTFYPQSQAIEADQLLRQADQAMYQAKQAGKNRYQLFDVALNNRLRGWQEDLGRIGQALIAQEFVLHYQPKVNMHTGEVVGAEALIRWQHPDKGLLAPAAFLPVFEDHPLAIEVGEWVIDTALTQMERWQAKGLQLPVSVNVGARQLQHPEFVTRLATLLARHPLVDPGSLELEILETSALQDVVDVSRLIEDCRQLGLNFALDDFGTGYSSLVCLKRPRAVLLKMDQRLVRDMLDDPDDLAIVQAVIGLASAFQCNVIAEGVETIAHGTQLLQLGCELAQGHGIARPMAAAAMSEWAASWQPDQAWRELSPSCRQMQ